MSTHSLPAAGPASNAPAAGNPKRARRARGAQTERIAETYWRENGWPYATVRRGVGTDLENTPGLSVEIKARRDFSPLAWLRQASAKVGLPIAIVRPDGMGPAQVGKWLVVMRHEDALALLREAGYGTEVEQ